MKKKVIPYIVTGIIFPVLVSLICDLIKSKTLFSTIINVLKEVIKFINKILTFKLSLWIILLIILIIILFRKFLSIKYKEPDFIKYTKDNIRNIIWTWSWKRNSEGKWHVYNLEAKCPKCNSTMIKYAGDVFGCPKCKYDTLNKDFDKPYEVERIILDNIENGYYNVTK